MNLLRIVTVIYSFIQSLNLQLLLIIPSSLKPMMIADGVIAIGTLLC